MVFFQTRVDSDRTANRSVYFLPSAALRASAVSDYVSDCVFGSWLKTELGAVGWDIPAACFCRMISAFDSLACCICVPLILFALSYSEGTGYVSFCPAAHFQSRIGVSPTCGLFLRFFSRALSRWLPRAMVSD